jgi:hypothetical protein
MHRSNPPIACAITPPWLKVSAQGIGMAPVVALSWPKYGLGGYSYPPLPAQFAIRDPRLENWFGGVFLLSPPCPTLPNSRSKIRDRKTSLGATLPSLPISRSEIRDWIIGLVATIPSLPNLRSDIRDRKTSLGGGTLPSFPNSRSEIRDRKSSFGGVLSPPFPIRDRRSEIKKLVWGGSLLSPPCPNRDRRSEIGKLVWGPCHSPFPSQFTIGDARSENWVGGVLVLSLPCPICDRRSEIGIQGWGPLSLPNSR